MIIDIHSNYEDCIYIRLDRTKIIYLILNHLEGLENWRNSDQGSPGSWRSWSQSLITVGASSPWGIIKGGTPKVIPVAPKWSSWQAWSQRRARQSPCLNHLSAGKVAWVEIKNKTLWHTMFSKTQRPGLSLLKTQGKRWISFQDLHWDDASDA